MEHDAYPSLDATHYSAVEDYMLTPSLRPSNGWLTFGEAMQLVGNNELPDLYALTAKSAIPLADAIRGYHDVVEAPDPSFIAVPANQQLSRYMNDEDASAEIETRAARLAPEVIGKTILLLDQFVSTGKTVNVAGRMLATAGAQSVVYSRRIRWYEGVHPSEVDVVSFTSDYSALMRRIGQTAALSQIKHELTKSSH